jgi:hypothetical protein
MMSVGRIELAYQFNVSLVSQYNSALYSVLEMLREQLPSDCSLSIQQESQWEIHGAHQNFSTLRSDTYGMTVTVTPEYLDDWKRLLDQAIFQYRLKTGDSESFNPRLSHERRFLG